MSKKYGLMEKLPSLDFENYQPLQVEFGDNTEPGKLLFGQLIDPSKVSKENLF